MKNKVLSFILAFVLALTLLQISVNAATYYEYGDLTYTVNSSEEITITDCSEDAAHITIPSQINGYTIVNIGANAFSGCSSLSSVVIPDSVTHIGARAFLNCTSLSSIKLSKNWTTVTSAAYSPFMGCTKLTSISIPEGATKIPDNAFKQHTALESIYIPESVTTIGASAFESCSNLQKVTVPKNVTDILGSAFKDCIELESVTMYDKLESINGGAFSGCGNLSNVTIPDSVTHIGARAFLNCTSLSSIKLSKNWTTVTSAAYSPFIGCTKLTSISIPEGATKIPDNAFKQHTALESIYIPESVTTIGASAFESCSKLDDIVLPDKIESIKGSCFNGCTNITEIVIYNFNCSISSSAFPKNDNFKLYCWENSPAHKYAENNSIDYELIADITPDTNITNFSLWKGIPEEIVIQFSDEVIDFDDGEISIHEYNKNENNEYVKIASTLNDTCFVDYFDDSDKTKIKVTIAGVDYSNAIPTNKKLFLKIDENTFTFAENSNNVFHGILEDNKDVFSFTTEKGLTYFDDTPNFANKDYDFFETNEKHRYYLSTELTNKLLNKCSLKFHKNKIIKAIDADGWGGSCAGISTIVAGTFNGLYDLNSIKNNSIEIKNVADIDAPKFSYNNGKEQIPYGVRDIINYYQLLQLTPNYPEEESYNANLIDKVQNLVFNSYSNTIQNVINRVKSIDSKGPFLFSIAWKEENSNWSHSTLKAHSLVAHRYREKGNGIIEIELFDPTNITQPAIATIDSVNNTFYIDGYYEGLDMVKIGYSEPKEIFGFEKKTSSSTTDSTVIYAPLSNDFKITGTGLNIEYSNGEFSGDFSSVSDVNILSNGTDEAATIMIEVPNVDLEIETDSNSLDFSIVAPTMFASIKADGANSVDFITSEKTMQVKGNNLDYTAYISSSKNSSFDMLSVSGETVGEITFSETEEDNIDVISSNMSNTKFNTFDGMDKTEYSINDNVKKISVYENNSGDVAYTTEIADIPNLKLTISNILNQDGKEITTDNLLSTSTISFDIQKNISGNISATFIVACYDNENRMLELFNKELTEITPNVKITDLTFPKDTTKIKIFAWNLKNIMPLADSVILPSDSSN